ncbi:MAG: 1-deoxy-D-xylulose-5-phosphate synthase, partial [Butyricicoccus sp.]|nr:1-deoxy-D-xylulose-5-phosphate synthase [Butyricicoccus sp.]
MKQYGVLDRIQSIADLRNLSYENLNELCASLREFIVDHVSQTGGHLASNLGIVELAVALEREFDSRKDRIVYDVGHQCYVHKILTGRKDDFAHLRQYGGISGFLRPQESETDACISGHASNSVSVALGMAHARTIRGQKYHVVAVIGDGALTGGMAYEALNSAGGSGEPLIVVLNDNNMSIDKNVGALSRHLAKLRISPRYMRTKTCVKQAFGVLPGGKALTRTISRVNSAVKSVMLPSSLFEDMGFAYLGPVDGHDMKAVCELLQLAKSMKMPVLIHVMTKKGKGCQYAEEHPDAFHGVSQFDPRTGQAAKKSSPSFSSVFGETLCDLARKDGRICAVTAAMPTGTGLSRFAEQFPNRFFDVGIAEEHAVAMTAGMAKQGLKPVCAIYSTFLQRGYDQLIHDIAIDGTIHAVFAVDRAGIVGADGATHNGVFDIAYLQSIPGFRILCPSNFAELRTMMTQAIYHSNSAVAIRYPRGGQGRFDADTAEQWAACVHGQNNLCQAAIITYGILINEAFRAAELLETQGIFVQIWKINEISQEHRLLSAQMIEQLCDKILV